MLMDTFVMLMGYFRDVSQVGLAYDVLHDDYGGFSVDGFEKMIEIRITLAFI